MILPTCICPIFNVSGANQLLSPTETPREEEEHRQLPLDENVPQGRRPTEEGRCPGLNYISFCMDNGRRYK